jgi:hypothetical protein
MAAIVKLEPIDTVTTRNMLEECGWQVYRNPTDESKWYCSEDKWSDQAPWQHILLDVMKGLKELKCLPSSQNSSPQASSACVYGEAVPPPPMNMLVPPPPDGQSMIEILSQNSSPPASSACVSRAAAEQPAGSGRDAKRSSSGLPAWVGMRDPPPVLGHGEAVPPPPMNMLVPPPPDGQSMIEILRGRAEPSGFENHECTHHERLSWDGSPFPHESQYSVTIWHQNVIDSMELLKSWCQSMDDRIFVTDKTGWSECWMRMTDPYSFNLLLFTHMKTSGGYCGSSVECRRCGLVCKIQWDKDSSHSDMQKARAHWLSYFGCPYTVPGSNSRPIV